MALSLAAMDCIERMGQLGLRWDDALTAAMVDPVSLNFEDRETTKFLWRHGINAGLQTIHAVLHREAQNGNINVAKRLLSITSFAEHTEARVAAGIVAKQTVSATSRTFAEIVTGIDEAIQRQRILNERPIEGDEDA